MLSQGQRFNNFGNRPNQNHRNRNQNHHHNRQLDLAHNNQMIPPQSHLLHGDNMTNAVKRFPNKIHINPNFKGQINPPKFST